MPFPENRPESLAVPGDPAAADASVRGSGVPPPPFVADGREHRLAPAWVRVERLSGAIASAIVSGLGLIGVLMLSLLGSPGLVGALLLLGGWLLASGALATLTYVWPAVSYPRIAYAVSDRGIVIRRGVLWRTVSSVPRSRVQHTDVSQGPIQRMHGIATLIIYTAGTHHASVSLDGLPHSIALAVRDHLIAGGTDDAV